MASAPASTKPNGSTRDDPSELRCGCIFIDCPSHLEWIKSAAMLQADCQPQHHFPHHAAAYFSYPLSLVRDAFDKKVPLPYIRCAKLANNPRIADRRQRIVVDLRVETLYDRDACEEILMAELHKTIETATTFWAFETMVIPLPVLSEASSRNPILCRFELDVPMSLKEQLVAILDDGSARKVTYVTAGRETVPEITVPRSQSPEVYPPQGRRSRAPALGRPPIHFSSERSPPAVYGAPPPPQHYPPPYPDVDRRYYDGYPPRDYHGAWDSHYDDPYTRNSRGDDPRAGPSTYGPILYGPYFPPNPFPSPVTRGPGAGPGPAPFPPEPMLMTREEAEARRLAGQWPYGAPSSPHDHRRPDYDYPPGPRYPSNWSHVPRAGEGDFPSRSVRRALRDAASGRHPAGSERSPESSQGASQAASPTRSLSNTAPQAAPQAASLSASATTKPPASQASSQTTPAATTSQTTPAATTLTPAALPSQSQVSPVQSRSKSAPSPVTPLVSKPTFFPHAWYDLIKEPRGTDGSEMRCACYYLEPPEWVVTLNSQQNLQKTKTYPPHRIDHTPYSYHYVPLVDLMKRKINMGSRPDWKAIREEPKTVRAVVDYTLKDLTAARHGSAIEDLLRAAFDRLGITLKQVWRKDSIELTSPSWRYVSRYEINLPVLAIPAFIAAVGSGRVTDLELIWLPKFEQQSDVWTSAQATAPLTYQPTASFSMMPSSKPLDKAAHKSLFRTDGTYNRPVWWKQWARVIIDFHLIPKSKTDKVDPTNTHGRVRTTLGTAGIFFVHTMVPISDPVVTPIGWLLRYELELNSENIPRLIAACGSRDDFPIRLIWAPTFAEHMHSDDVNPQGAGEDTPMSISPSPGESGLPPTIAVELPASPDASGMDIQEVSGSADIEIQSDPSGLRPPASGSLASTSHLAPGQHSAERRPAPEIIDLTASPAGSATSTPVLRPAELAPSVNQHGHSVSTAPPGASVAAMSGRPASVPWHMPHPRLQGHPSHLHIHIMKPAPQAPVYHAFGPPPVIRPPAQNRPKEVIDLSQLSDQGSPEPIPRPVDFPGSSLDPQNTRLASVSLRSHAEESERMAMERVGSFPNGRWNNMGPNGPIEDDEDDDLESESFAVGNTHYSADPATLKPEPRLLSPNEEKEVTDWYKGAAKRKQQLLEQQANGGSRSNRGARAANERENGRSSSRPARLRPYPDQYSPGVMDYSLMNGIAVQPPIMQAVMPPPIEYRPYVINNAKLQPLTLTGNGAVVLGTCRKLFRRYKIEMCHGCDTKQRCSRKDMWKMPDPNDPVGARLIEESAAVAASRPSSDAREYRMMNGSNSNIPPSMMPGPHPSGMHRVPPPHLPYPTPHGYPDMPPPQFYMAPPGAYPHRMPPAPPPGPHSGYDPMPYPLIADPHTPTPTFGATTPVPRAPPAYGQASPPQPQAGPSNAPTPVRSEPSRGQKRPGSPSLT